MGSENGSCLVLVVSHRHLEHARTQLLRDAPRASGDEPCGTWFGDPPRSRLPCLWIALNDVVRHAIVFRDGSDGRRRGTLIRDRVRPGPAAHAVLDIFQRVHEEAIRQQAGGQAPSGVRPALTGVEEGPPGEGERDGE